MSKKFDDKRYNGEPWNKDPWEDNESVTEYRGKTQSYTAKCAHSHPALKFKVEGKEYKIYGGACASPIVKDADVYIGLDRFEMGGSNQWPWEKSKIKKAIEFAFHITDMAAPSNATDFKNMIDWVCNQLHEGKKVHVGCMGGHGRTGTVLVAVYAQMTGDKDAIQYVRQHYCTKAVESKEQVNFLMKHYGISKAAGAKEFGGTKFLPSTTGKVIDSPKPAVQQWSFTNSKRTIAPMPSKRFLWNA